MLKLSYLLLLAVLVVTWAKPSAAQGAAKLPSKIDDGFVLWFRPPDKLAVDIDDRAWQNARMVTLSPQAKLLNHKNKPVTAQAFRAGMEVEIKLAPESSWTNLVAASVKIKNDPEKEVKVEGYLDKATDEEAYVDGQPVLLRPGAVIKGTNEWRNKTFTKFAAIPLGARLSLRGARQPDGFIYVTQGEAKPNTFTVNDMALTVNVQVGLVRPPAGQAGAGVTINNESYPVCENLILNQYVTKVGYKVVPRYLKESADGSLERLLFRFYVLADTTPLASSLPDGSVFVSMGLLGKLDNEAQLAVILGREIAHVTNEHFRRGAESAEKRSIWVGLGAAAAGAMLGTEVGTAVNVASSRMLARKFAKDLEKQADRVGLFYAYDAGYDLPANISALNSRQRNMLREFFVNYPKTDFREALTEAGRYKTNVSSGCSWVEPKLPALSQAAPAVSQPPKASPQPQPNPRRKTKRP